MGTSTQALRSRATDTQAAADFDRRNLDWYVDKLVAGIVFVCGISAILFVLGIFFFVTKEGIGFVFEKMDFREFFLTPYWSPSDAEDPEYGILALMAGTASVTGLAMLVAVPFSLGAAIFIAEFASGNVGNVCDQTTADFSAEVVVRGDEHVWATTGSNIAARAERPSVGVVSRCSAHAAARTSAQDQNGCTRRKANGIVMMSDKPASSGNDPSGGLTPGAKSGAQIST